MEQERKIPKVMSTQHPDNVDVPFFCKTSDFSGDDEIQEAYYMFSHANCDEQMWDSEGKEIDQYVIRKLLQKYQNYFKKNRIGKDKFITLRIPNPSIEKDEAKIVVETLESIPRSFDIAKLFYGDGDYAPIFEIILPMTTSDIELNRLYYFYKNYISGKQHYPITYGDILIRDWVGEFLPETINVIPLFENVENILNSHNVIRKYIENKHFVYHRVFFARSDPAMYSSHISAILANKVALQRLRKLSEETGVKFYPILGVGSPPFRGHLTPYNVDNVIKEYPEVYTFTVQSAFKYDNPLEDVQKAIKKLKNFPRRPFHEIDEEEATYLIKKISDKYRAKLEQISSVINQVAKHVPRRRRRKTHTGLFGYSRSIGDIQLPRVIGFCASGYSIGFPPELLSIMSVDEEDYSKIKHIYVNFEEDTKAALRYFNPDSLKLLGNKFQSIMKIIDHFEYEPDLNHKEITSSIINDLLSGTTSEIQNKLVEAAHIRKFLG
ncbi:MAG: phosphoenolpyruvate carboxylase [Leptospiraceae bacterium]|nr:phosphoenolpyruvate carboxylase [Leptospiraceae bacterium]MDW7975742.1 phosphoenolpyruvate carboxylase [Leptospiraceae bacterium]